MQKILLSIVAVFCLQATFQAYLAVEQSRDEYQAMTRATPLNDRLGDFPIDVAALNEDQVPDADVLPITARHIARPVQRAEYASYRKPAPVKRVPETIEARTFNPVIISIPAPARYQTTAFTREPMPMQAAVKKEKKKSLPAKTFAVIKKPYEWLKAFASKFKG